MGDDGGEWRLELVGDAEIPGWFLLPHDLGSDAWEQWVDQGAEVLAPLVGTEGPTGRTTTEADIREELVAGLSARRASESFVMFQVWPVSAATSLLCHANLLGSEALPSWRELGVVHTASAANVGPGLQCSTRRTVSVDGTSVDLIGVHFVFDDGDVALILSLEESVPQVITRALSGFVALKDLVHLWRADGDHFVSRAPDEFAEEHEWQIEEV